MSESKPRWTPGPWKPWGSNRSLIITDYILPERQNCCKDITYMCKWDQMPDTEKEANAHLIAAAPGLYEALLPLGETLLRPETANRIAATIIEFTGDGELAVYIHELLTDGTALARQALAKARGEEAPK